MDNRFLAIISDITCPGGYRLNPYRGTCVRFVRTQLSWSGAKFTCENSREHLATFDTVESASWYRNQQVTRGEWVLLLSVNFVLQVLSINETMPLLEIYKCPMSDKQILKGF